MLSFLYKVGLCPIELPYLHVKPQASQNLGFADANYDRSLTEACASAAWRALRAEMNDSMHTKT